MARSSKYWYANEKKVMKQLGLKPVPGSGSGELYKEDGENENILCQLKSTESNKVAVDRLDVEKLMYHADLVNKIPIFVIQFMNGPMLIATLPEELGNISKYLNEGLFVRKQVEIIEPPKQKKTNKVKASAYTIEDTLRMAKESIEEEPEEEEQDFLSKAFAKRNKRKGNKYKGG